MRRGPGRSYAAGMRTLVVVENLSLDGVMPAPGRADRAPGEATEDERGGFTHGGWASRMLADDPDGEGELVVLGGAPAPLFCQRG